VANYNANINITVAGASRLNAVTASVERLNNLSQNLKPLNLLAPGGGKLGDSIRLAIKPINDFARSVENGNKRISNTFAGAVQQANVFRTVLENVKVAAGGYEKQSASVKLYANALAEAEKQASKLSVAQNDLARTAKGLQTQSERDFEYYRRLNTIQSGRIKQRQQEARATQAINEAERIAVSVRERETARVAAQQARGKRIRGAVSEGIIGGSFPLLFGQGPGAAAGGAIGGIAGGLLGPGGGFAGSLLGTLLGGIAEQGNKIKELAGDIGFTAQQTLQLQAAFKLAGADADKFTEAVQNIRGVGLEIEDQAKAIQLVSVLTEKYGGNITKVTNALTNALESGKVTQATLNQLSSQGIDIQGALATKYKTNRDIILQMAKDGKISVQDLINTMVDLGNRGTDAVNKNKTAVDVLKDSWNNLASAISNIASVIVTKLTPVFDWLVRRLADIVNIAANAFAQIGALVDRAAMGPKAAAVKSVQQGKLPFGTQGVVELIGEARTRQLQKQAGPGMLGLGFNTDKFVKLLQQQPEFKATATGKLPTLSTFKAPSQFAEAGGAPKVKKNKAADDAAREAARVAEVIRDRMAETEMLRIQGQLQEKISNAELVKDASLVARLNGEKEILDIQYRYAQELANEQNINAQQAIIQKGLQAIENSRLNTLLKVEEIEAQRTEKYTDLLTKFDREIELAGIKDEAAKKLRQIEFDIIDLRKQGILLTEEEITAYRNRAVAAAGTGTQGPGQKRMEELKTELAELTNLENVAVLAADNMGNAFGQAFQEIINGSSSAQEALANMMRSIGENFINMAAQIIAKQTTMMILGTILKALGIFSGAASGGGGFSSNAAGFGGSVDAGIPALPNIPDYSGAFKANGGPVSAGAPYVVGEHGPELFVPGRNGSVVSNSGLRDAMGAAPGSGSPVLNMSFQTTSIGGVEYVSRDQLEAAMAETRRQATRDGANRGMTMTLDRIKQSPQTRSRIGIR